MRKFLFAILLCIVEILYCGNLFSLNRCVVKSKEVEASDFDIITKRIVDDIKLKIALDDSRVELYMNLWNNNGTFPDINYQSTDRALWEPLRHLDRMLEIGVAFVSPESHYYKDESVKRMLDAMLLYWHTKEPRSTNWYQNEIAEPQRMGMFLMLIQNCGFHRIPQDLFDKSLDRLKNNGGDPSEQTGANRVDVALHWLYRACLTRNSDLLKLSMEYIYSPIMYTMNSEGLQCDNSYTQHGRQLHIGQYGDAFLDGITKASCYAIGTSVALSGERLAILSKFVRDTYLSVIRGSHIAYNVIGRASTRPDALQRRSSTVLMDRMILLDPIHADKYKQAKDRLTGSKSAEYCIESKSRYFYKTNYSVHIRPEYVMDLRFVSKDVVKNEQGVGNKEAYKQYFLSDGSTGIFIKGDEYENIFPVWDYTKIPGVTCPNVEKIPVDESYITYGQADIAGGVTDSVYNVSAYQYVDKRYGIGTSANKAWFFFDKEIVCLGNNICSTSQNEVNTTINQCSLDGKIIVSVNGKSILVDRGRHVFVDSLEWILHGQIGYFFLQNSKVKLDAENRTGNWKNINGNYDQEISKDVFTLCISHGIKPTQEKYAYAIVPDMQSVEDARNYDMNKMKILENSEYQQAIYHAQLDVYGIVFYKPSVFEKSGIRLKVDQPCVLMLKNINKMGTTELHVASLLKNASEIHIDIETPLKGTRSFLYKVGKGYEGQTLCWILDR